MEVECVPVNGVVLETGRKGGHRAEILLGGGDFGNGDWGEIRDRCIIQIVAKSHTSLSVDGAADSRA